MLRLSMLIEEFHSIKQGNLEVTNYYTNLRILWEEIMILRLIPQCKCEPKCKCDALKAVRNYMESDYSNQIFEGAP